MKPYYFPVAVFSLVSLMIAESAMAQSPVSEIMRFADELCGAAPGPSSSEQSSARSVELGANVDARLTTLLGKLGDLGVGGSAKLRQEKSTGILQKDLAAERGNSRDCRFKVFDRLVGQTDILNESSVAFAQTYHIVVPVSRVPFEPRNMFLSGLTPEDARSGSERCKDSWLTFNNVSICVREIKLLSGDSRDGTVALSVHAGGEKTIRVDASSSGQVSLRTFLCNSVKIEGVPQSFKVGGCPVQSVRTNNKGKSRRDLNCEADEVKLYVTAQCRVPRK